MKQQTGFAHNILLLAITLCLAMAIILTGLRLKNRQTLTQNSLPIEPVITADLSGLDSTVDANSALPTKEVLPVNQKRTISFMNGEGRQQGDYIVVSATLSENQVGTCTYSFYLNGSKRLEQTNGAIEQNLCKKSILTYDFPEPGTYSFVLSFLSTDGNVSANQSSFFIEVE